jgi:Tfp pilus assembly protein FimT
MLVTVALVAIVSAAVLPALSDDTRLRLMAASAVIASDIELAQTMTISRPDDAVVVRFDADKSTYWIAPAGDTETPITREASGEPYEIQLGKGRASSADGVTFVLHDMGTNMLEFNAQGGLKSFINTPIVELQLGNQKVSLSVNPTTGSITEAYGVITDDEDDGGLQVQPTELGGGAEAMALN